MLCQRRYILLLLCIGFLYTTLSVPLRESKKWVENPCRDHKKCDSLGDRIFRVNSNYEAFGNKEYKSHFDGFDILDPLPSWTPKRRFRRNAVNVREWPKSKDGLIYIPYTVRDYATSVRISPNMLKAQKEFETLTCYRLIERTIQKDYVEIVDHNGCWSSVGQYGGKQYLSLSDGCEEVNIILHEFMHVIGFYHEQSRRDRDQHIKMNWTNIAIDDYDQFKVRPYGTAFVHGKSFDIHSIMQYGRNAGGIDDRYDVMTPIKFANEKLGVIDGASFSPSDLQELNLKSLCGSNVKMYGGPYAYKGDDKMNQF